MDHGNESGGGKRCVQICAHNGPCSAQNGIRQAEADECKINNQKKHGSHRTKYPRFFFSEFSKKDKEFRIICPALQRYVRSTEIPESRWKNSLLRAGQKEGGCGDRSFSGKRFSSQPRAAPRAGDPPYGRSFLRLPPGRSPADRHC